MDGGWRVEAGRQRDGGRARGRGGERVGWLAMYGV